MKKFSLSDINNLDKRYTTQLINCISGVKSANLIGTKSLKGETNLAIFNSVIHLGSDPALIGFIQRPASVERHTFENILATEKYTINAVYKDIIFQSHQTAARYNRSESEFEETSLQEHYLDGFFAPFVKDSPLKYSLHLEEVIPIKSNNTKLVVGSVQSLYFDDKLVNNDGSLSLDEADITGLFGLDTYVSVNKIAKLTYAKPDQPLKNLL